MKYFFDSSGIFAWADASNPHGKAIGKILKSQKEPLVTTNLIIAETISLVTKRIGKGAGIKLGEHLLASQLLHVIFIDEPLQSEAWAFYKKYKDKDFDLIDAASFTVCRKMGIKGAITLDGHFRQVGMEMVPLLPS